MRIVCPSCGVAYQVPAALLEKRHVLKCSACGVKWRLQPPAEAPAAPATQHIQITDAPPAPPTSGFQWDDEPVAPVVPPVDAESHISSEEAATESGHTDSTASGPAQSAPAEAEHAEPGASSEDLPEVVADAPASVAPEQPPAERQPAGHFAAEDVPEQAPHTDTPAPDAEHEPVQWHEDPSTPEQAEPTEDDALPEEWEGPVAEDGALEEELEAQQLSAHSEPEPEPEPEPEAESDRVSGPLSGLAASYPQGQRPAVSDEPSSQSQPFQFTAYAQNRVAEPGHTEQQPAATPVSSMTEDAESMASGAAASQIRYSQPSQSSASPAPEGRVQSGLKAGYQASQQAAQVAKAGASSAYRQVAAKGADLGGRVGEIGSIREFMLMDAFWRWAWIISIVVAVLVLLAGYHWWHGIVRIWPAAARLHQPG
nr:zinc-ribbon domain-containing protein [uncultured Acetobacter sp.]